MKKTKIATITILSVVAALIPAALMVEEFKQGMMGGHVLEAEVSQEEVLDMSTLVVKGQIMNSKVVKTQNAEGEKTAFTIWKLKPIETYKGTHDGKKIHFSTFGGDIGNNKFTAKAIDFQRGEIITVMLVKDVDSVYGEYYHLVSVQQGAYKIDAQGNAKSVNDKHDKKEVDLDLLIKDHLK